MISVRQNIIECARDLFLSQGFYKTPIDAIASELRISKKTIYKYFPSKEKLLNEIANNVISGYNKKIKQITGNPQVALCLNNIQIEAKAEILGRSNEEKNSCFLDFHRRKFSEVYVKTFTNIHAILLVRLTPIVITKFDNIDNRFHFTKLDIKNEKAFQMRLEDKENPEYPY